MKGLCYIVGAGQCYGLGFVPGENDLVIAADGGLRYLEEAGIKADMVVGDFDTLGYRPAHDKVIELKPEKDITDTYAAIEMAMQRGYSEFHLYCCLGGKIEHTLANIQIMAGMAKRGIRIFLHGDETVMVAVNCGSISFGEEAEGMISVFAHGTDAEGVSLRGLKYELMNASLSCDFPLGVSNEFLGRESLVSVEKGVLILVISQEAMRWMKR